MVSNRLSRAVGGERRRLARPAIRAVLLAVAAWGAGAAGAGAAGAGAAPAESVLEKAATLRAEGRFDEALDVLRAESREIKQADGDASPRLLPINDLAAEILIDQGDLETAAALLDKTIAASQKLVDAGRREHAPALGRSLLTLSRLETAAKRFPAAVAAARRALLVLDGAPDRAEADIARARDALRNAVGTLADVVGADATATREAQETAAATFASLGMLSEAIEQRRLVLEGLASNPGADAAALLEATERLGRLMIVAGRAEEAAPIVETSLAALGADHPRETVAARRLLGDLQVAADKLVLAEGTFAEVLEATRREAKPSAAVEAGDRLRCLLVAVRRGTADRLPEWFDLTLKNLIRPMPTDILPAIPGLVLASEAQQALAQPAAAVEPLGRAQVMAGAIKTPDAVQLADLAARLAAAQLAAGDTAAARKTAEQALAVAERNAGPGDAGVGALRVALADALAREGQADKAATLAAKALERGLPRPDDRWEERATAIYDRLADTAGHADLRDQYIAARVRQFGEQHAHVASACGLFGAARLAAGDWPAAGDFYSRAIEIDRAALGGEHPEVAANLVLLARAEREAGEPKRAVETATSALAAWEHAAGEAHPGTLAAVEELVEAKVQSGDTAGIAELVERLCAADAGDDPARRAAHLVRLADVTAARDKVRAKDLLEKAMRLPCWQDDAAPSPAGRQRLAFTAALAAHAYRATGDAAAATDAVQRARSLVVQADTPEPVLARIDRIAAQGDGPGRP